MNEFSKIKSLKIENRKLLGKIIRNYSLKALMPISCISVIAACSLAGRTPFYQDEYIANEIKTSIYNEDNLDTPVETFDYQKNNADLVSKLTITSPYTKTDEGYECQISTYYFNDYSVEDIKNVIINKDINLIENIIDRSETETRITENIEDANNDYTYQAELKSGDKTTGIIKRESLGEAIVDTTRALFYTILIGVIAGLTPHVIYKNVTKRSDYDEMWISYDIKEFKKEMEINKIIIEETEKKLKYNKKYK